MMEHVRLNHIGATDAARLVKTARDKGRYDEFISMFETCVSVVQERLEREVAQLAEQDETSLHPVEVWPNRQLSREQLNSWGESLDTGTPFVEPSFRYRALLKREKGQQRIVVDPLDIVVADLSAEDTAKLYRRFVDLSVGLEPVLQEKAESEREGARAGETADADPPGLRRLRELGLGHLVPSADDPEAATDESAEASSGGQPPAGVQTDVLDRHFGRSDSQ
jgi:hypothetical protein